MRAMQLEEAGFTAAVAKRDQLLAKNLDLERQVLQLVRKAYRLPEMAHVFAARRIRADMGQLGIFLGDVPVVISAVAGL